MVHLSSPNNKSPPAGMLLMALIRSPAHAHITSGLTDMGVPSLSTSPRRSLVRDERKAQS